MPFQHSMAENQNHFHHGRAFPLAYVRKLLALGKPYDVAKDTPMQSIMEYYKELGVDYEVEWTQWYHSIGLASTLALQNWQPDNFQYVVQNGKVYTFSVVDGTIQVGDFVPDAKPEEIQVKDKRFLQNYGRPY